MTTLTELHAEISTELRRGSAFDSLIPEKTKDAIKTIEQMHTFMHMDKLATVNITSGDRVITLPTGLKRIEGWRLLLTGSTSTVFKYLNKVDYYDVSKLEAKIPNAFYLNGKETAYLDNIPGQDYVSEMAYTGFTVVGDDLSAELTIVQDMKSLVKAAAVMLFAPTLRDPNLITLYTPQYNTLLKAAIDSDVEAREGAASESIQYGWEFRNRVNLDENGNPI